MILQNLGKTQVVYMPDIDAGHIALGDNMGLCDIYGKPAPHATITKGKHITDCGMQVDAWHMVGQTVDIYVVPSRINLKDTMGKTLCDALNSFDRPRYDFDRYTFTGKFSVDARPGVNTYTVADKAGRKLGTYREAIKDFPGIFNLMGHLGDNNGALFQPVIARYMWGLWHLMHGRKEPPKFHPVGYLDLHEYLCVMRDNRKDMFSRQAGAALINIQFSGKPYLEVTGIDETTGQALLAFGNAVVIDREKDKAFKPFVLVSSRPLEIKDDLKFHWTKVQFEGHSVFLMPVMVRPQSFVNGMRMVDLLSPKQL